MPEQLPEFKGNLREFLAHMELYYVEWALSEAKNNRNKAARLLGLNRTTIIEKMRKFDILKTTPPFKKE